MHPILPMLLLMSAVVAACASSRPGAPRRDTLGPWGERFDQADADKDEALSRDEAQAGIPELMPVYAQIDTDGNGVITRAELRSYVEWQRIVSQPLPEIRELRRQ